MRARKERDWGLTMMDDEYTFGMREWLPISGAAVVAFSGEADALTDGPRRLSPRHRGDGPGTGTRGT
jgi:hypothetical protein